eukprot:Amastigsp_a1000_165.p2 type:complete len:182 gc:universal Amastigsp_a1000_165:1202-657(-)
MPPSVHGSQSEQNRVRVRCTPRHWAALHSRRRAHRAQGVVRVSRGAHALVQQVFVCARGDPLVRLRVQHALQVQALSRGCGVRVRARRCGPGDRSLPAGHHHPDSRPSRPDALRRAVLLHLGALRHPHLAPCRDAVLGHVGRAARAPGPGRCVPPRLAARQGQRRRVLLLPRGAGGRGRRL